MVTIGCVQLLLHELLLLSAATTSAKVFIKLLITKLDFFFFLCLLLLALNIFNANGAFLFKPMLICIVKLLPQIFKLHQLLEINW